MPELPEVETVRRALSEHVVGKKIANTKRYRENLRWPIPADLSQKISGKTVKKILRRAKYLIVPFDRGSLICHLGMSGRIRLVNAETPLIKHDHCDFVLDNGWICRYHDPRRFGAILWAEGDWQQHALFKHLGPEPLEDGFNAEDLFARCQKSRCDIKQHIMNQKVVVGVGNIYANEALFMAGIHPQKPANQLMLKEIEILTASIKKVIAAAVEQGGTTLKDFSSPEGHAGYFQQKLMVYGRHGKPCVKCEQTLETIQQGGRRTVFCVACQPESE